MINYKKKCNCWKAISPQTKLENSKVMKFQVERLNCCCHQPASVWIDIISSSITQFTVQMLYYTANSQIEECEKGVNLNHSRSQFSNLTGHPWRIWTRKAVQHLPTYTCKLIITSLRIFFNHSATLSKIVYSKSNLRISYPPPRKMTRW